MSWTTPSEQVTGHLVTATEWNQLVDDLAYLASANADLFLGVTSSVPTYKAVPPAQNLLTNPAKAVWQRGNGPTTKASGTSTYTADRYLLTVAGGDSVTWEKKTDEIDTGMTYSLRLDYTKSSGGTVIRQKLVPAYEFPGYIPPQLSYRVRVKCSVVGGVLAYISDNVDHEHHSSTNASTSWESLSLDGKAITSSTTDIDVGLIPQQSCTIWVGWEVLTGLTKSSDYQPMNAAEEFLRCQRYYEVIGGSSGGVFFNVYTAATGDIGQTIAFNVHKAATPTCTKVGTWDTVSGGSTGQPSINGTPSQHGFTIKAAVSSATGHMNGFSTPDATCYVTADSSP